MHKRIRSRSTGVCDAETFSSKRPKNIEQLRFATEASYSRGSARARERTLPALAKNRFISIRMPKQATRRCIHVISALQKRTVACFCQANPT